MGEGRSDLSSSTPHRRHHVSSTNKYALPASSLNATDPPCPFPALVPTLRQAARPAVAPLLARPIASSSRVERATLPSPSSSGTVTTEVANNAFALAKSGSNQLSLETPRNGVEYALGTMDKIVNWARQGSMWPMVRSPSPRRHGREWDADSFCTM